MLGFWGSGHGGNIYVLYVLSYYVHIRLQGAAVSPVSPVFWARLLDHFGAPIRFVLAGDKRELRRLNKLELGSRTRRE